MNKTIDLNGAWQLRWNNSQRGGNINRLWSPEFDASRAIEAHVPGSVHLDLIRAGIIEDPNTSLNALAARWVEEYYWYYRRSFQAPDLQPDEHVFLHFDTLDLAAVIYLNGVEVARHNNAFYPCTVEITPHLKPGENILVVSIEAGLFSVSDKQGTGYNQHLDTLLHKRHWLRKTQSSFEWDWTARLLNVGISGPVRLYLCNTIRLEQAVALAALSPDLKTGTVTGRLFVDGVKPTPTQATLTVEIPGSGLQVSREVTINAGSNRLEAQLTLENPRLWWPVGHGEQALYGIHITLQAGSAVLVDETRRVGFRTVRVNQDPHPEGGTYFIFYINNKPIFFKGGNLVPADMILARLDAARYQGLVARALEANFNMLRIWGGGLYESDELYALCDEKGILLWQEFIFACAKYPAHDEAFLADVKREAAYQVRRLAYHPSLVAWCGNNEIEVGYYYWGYEKGVAIPDYSLYHLTLPRILKEEDGTRYYQPSSPYSPDHDSPARDDTGDQHPWQVGFSNTDFRDYRVMICRFPNEGGILGPTALPTIKACLPKGQERPGSFAWEQHDNGVAFWDTYNHPDAMLLQWLGRSIEAMTLEEYTYYGGVVQGEGLSEYIRNFRRRMFNSAAAVFWMYNDCWPAVRSWTIVDYYQRRTPSFHPVRRAFLPVITALAVEGNSVKVFGVNEGPAWQGDLRFGLFALSGGFPLDRSLPVTLPANTSTLLAQFALSAWQQLGETTHAAFAILSQNGREVARDRLFLPYFKEMLWSRAAVRMRLEDEQAIFECDTFAWRVCLDLDGEKPLSDNFFDIFPGIPTVLDWPATLGKPEILATGNLI